MMTNPLKAKLVKFWRTEGRSFLILVLVMCAFRSAIADWNDVPTGSMKPTILEGDRVVVNKVAYDLKVPFTTLHLAQWADPQRGDIVVCYSPADGIRLVKRVVGVPGDRIAMRNDQLFINGVSAKYKPLSQAVVAQLPAAERSYCEFASEEVQGRSHAVMAIPAIDARRSFDEMVIPAGSYFMMGDNRDNSKDSRYFGCVKRDQILGRVSTVAFSLDPAAHRLPRAGRYLSALQ
jgi:signal peptidase I